MPHIHPDWESERGTRAKKQPSELFHGCRLAVLLPLPLGLSMLLQPFPVVLCVLFLCPPTPHSLDLSVCVLFVIPQNPLSSTRHPLKYMSNLTRWFCGLAVFISPCSQMSLWDVLSPGASLFRRMWPSVGPLYSALSSKGYWMEMFFLKCVEPSLLGGLPRSLDLWPLILHTQGGYSVATLVSTGLVLQ